MALEVALVFIYGGDKVVGSVFGDMADDGNGGGCYHKEMTAVVAVVAVVTEVAVEDVKSSGACW